jgi:cobalt-zinc-cadmium efflux system protein
MNPHVSHHQAGNIKGNRLLASTILNLIISIAEISGGLISNSLSLISDALHNLSDGLAIFIAWIANRISKRPSNSKRTFGYKRIEILAAFFNALILIAISLYLFYEAILRIIAPEPVKGLIMIIVALIGLLANLAAVLLLRRDAKKNINIKAAYLHLFGDTLSSFSVIFGGVLIYVFDLFWLDPIITILIGVYIIKETWTILKQTIDILMQGSPSGLDLNLIRLDLEQIPEIANIHHVHIWNLDDQSVHFECHVALIENSRISETDSIYYQIEKVLKEKHLISHLTIQFEHQLCDDKDMIHQ